MPAVLQAASIKSWLNNSGPIVLGNEALKNGCITPQTIDDWAFNYNIIEDGFKLVE
jgi:hypothetical protein